MGYRDLSVSYDLQYGYNMGLTGTTSSVVIVVTEISYNWYKSVNALSKKPGKSRNIILRSEGNLHSRTPMSENGTQTVSIMANKKGPGPPTRYEDVQMVEDSGIDCCLVSTSTATRLLNGCESEPLESNLIVSTSSGETYICSHKFDARWCWKSIPSSNAITLFIAPGLGNEAIFSQAQISEPNTSGGSIAPIEYRPPRQGQDEQDERREADANKTKEEVIKKQQSQKKEFYGSPKKKL